MTTPLVHPGAEPCAPAAIPPALELINADLADSCQWVPTVVVPAAAPLPIYPQPQAGGATEHSLARANGCDSPACARGAHDPKTPAAAEKGGHVVAARVNGAGDTPPRETLQRPMVGVSDVA